MKNQQKLIFDHKNILDCRRKNNEVKSATKMPELNTRNRPGARMLPSNRLPNLKVCEFSF